MKICYLCADRGISLGGHNGSSTHLRSLVRALTALGHELLVITPSAGGGEDLGVPVIQIPVSEVFDALSSDARQRLAIDPSPAGWAKLRVVRALGHLWANVAVEQVLRDVLPSYQPDLVYERYSPFSVAGGITARRMGVPHILNVNAPLAWEGARYRRQALQEAAEALEHAALSSASLIVTTCRELRDELVAAGAVASKVEVVPMGVDVDLFAPRGPAYRRRPAGKVVIGFVGSLKPWHGVDVLAEAFRQVATDRRFELLIVGHGPMAEVLQALGDELPGRVRLVGGLPQVEVPAYVRAMDVAVAPYPPLEKFYYSPLKVLEYMAAGRAVVASRIGQIVDLIRDGETGLLVPPGDAAALAEAIRGLADDPRLRRALGAKAAADARRAHTWTNRAGLIVDLARAVA